MWVPQNLHQGRLLGGSSAPRASLRRAFSSFGARTSPSKASILASTSLRRASSGAGPPFGPAPGPPPAGPERKEARSAVNVPPMVYPDHQDGGLPIPDVADQAIVPHPVLPKPAELRPSQGLPEASEDGPSGAMTSRGIAHLTFRSPSVSLHGPGPCQGQASGFAGLGGVARPVPWLAE